MRYIWAHHRLSAVLGEAQGVSRIKSAFFFHYRGTHVQKSFEGMLHSVLLGILEQEPWLASVLLPDFAKLEPRQREKWNWTLAKLMKAYDDILVQNQLPVEIFLFLDALDEYDGPPEGIVSFIRSSVEKSSTGRTRLKVCFSSREWSAFEYQFSRGPGFRIHEHTDGDLRNYISVRLSHDPDISLRLTSGMEQERSDVLEMEESLANRAHGVFIWVRAVADEIVDGFSRNKSTSELLKLLKSFPSDLNSFYVEAIKRIPLNLRMEAFFMFEVMARCDGTLTAIEIRDAVSCAEFGSLHDCVKAIGRCREVPSSESPISWAQDRGAGLIELDNTHRNGTYPSVTFIHQTVLDFISMPGFRGLILDHAFTLPLDNGYSVLSKWMFSREEQILAGHDREFPSCSTTNLLARAEATTGKSMKTFLDSLEVRALVTELDRLGCPGIEISNPKISFAVIQGLKVFIQEVIEEHSGVIPDKGDFSLLHCLLKHPISYLEQPHFPVSDSPNFLDMVPLLVHHGARLNAVWQEGTPFQTLFKDVQYTKFRGDHGYHVDDAYNNAFARHLLSAGANPNVNLSVELPHRRRQPAQRVTCKPLHVATTSQAAILLEFGAKVNVFDGKGRTPLDLACGVGGNPYELGDHVRPDEAYPLAHLLISHGARLSVEGQKIWPRFAGMISSEMRVSDEFMRPGVVRRTRPSAIMMKAKDLKTRLTKYGRS